MYTIRVCPAGMHFIHSFFFLKIIQHNSQTVYSYTASQHCGRSASRANKSFSKFSTCIDISIPQRNVICHLNNQNVVMKTWDSLMIRQIPVDPARFE